MRIFYLNTTKKNHQHSSLESRDIKIFVNAKNDSFCNFLEIKAKTKKVVGVKVVPFGVLYSWVKFRRLKMGDHVDVTYRLPREFIARPGAPCIPTSLSNITFIFSVQKIKKIEHFSIFLYA